MRLSIILICALTFLAFTCEDESGKAVFLEEGDYTGEYFFSNPFADVYTASVTLKLENGNFEGTSSIRNYPAICRGTYQLRGDQITFANTCAFTADFNWNRILSGTYKLSRSGETIEMRRDYDDNTADIYRLSLSE